MNLKVKYLGKPKAKVAGDFQSSDSLVKGKTYVVNEIGVLGNRTGFCLSGHAGQFNAACFMLEPVRG